MTILQCPKCHYNLINYSTVVTVKSTQTLLCFDSNWEINASGVNVTKTYEYVCGNSHCGFKTTNIDDVIHVKKFEAGIKRCLESIEEL